MKVLSKSWVLFLLIAAAMPVFAITRPFTLVGRTDTGRTHPNYPFQTYIGFNEDAPIRLFRTGGTNGTCDAPVAAPTQTPPPGSFKRSVMGVATRDSNGVAVAECITVKFHGVRAGERYSVAIYTTDPNPEDLNSGLLGYSRDWVDGPGDVQFFSFRKPANVNQYYVVVYGIASNTHVGYYIDISSSHAASSDFDGDGQTDSSVFRPSSGAWYILQSSNNTLRVDFFGGNGDVPLEGDFDGDGKSDTSIFRPSDGTWYYKRSYNNTVFGAYFGLGTDKPVPGDYDKDGISDIGAYRDGQWLISPSAGVHSQVTGYAFGAPGDIPVGSQRK